MPIKASYYDGSSAVATQVTIYTQGNNLVIEGLKEQNNYLIQDICCEAPFANSPLIIELPDGGRIECKSYDQHFLSEILKRESRFLLWLERNKGAILTTVVLTVLLGIFFVQKVEPLIAHTIAHSIDQKIVDRFDHQVLSIIDNNYVKKSKLPVDIQEDLRFEIMKYTHRDDLEILFRQGYRVGANAFALGGKTMIITDELIEKVNNKKLVLSIAFHELGHLKHRHFLERTISGILYNFLYVFALGDLTGFTESLAQAGMGLIFLKNSRAHESEADLYSFNLLKSAGLSPVCFANSMQILSGVGVNQSSNKKSDFFSTHPSTQKRIEDVFKTHPNASDCDYDPKNIIYERNPVNADPNLRKLLNKSSNQSR